ncbi:MAG: phosphoribosylformylglycinamidine synthase subunit PurL [Candidatus Eisenbacteria bacterium]|nr:phosphoribosylformylglycinamidine synthase subunit PurL [Candidatus Eisenbacteria bacterium]
MMPESDKTVSVLPVDRDLADRLTEARVRLNLDEARRVAALLGRPPTLVELVLFDTMWSEHCSYKSSRSVLKEFLPTEAPNVLLGPGEDAGIIYLTSHKGERWGLVVAHESHNHPSQVVPAEGAATGVGGIVRDVYCMGADVVGVLDALRFGDLTGESAERCREVAEGVVTGIWQYANALGVPNLGGDVWFDSGYDDNCLVNVVAVGVVREKDIVRSRVPKVAADEPYDVILLGKPTDASGFGGASFSSAVLSEADLELNKGAVQLPDPFLKRVIVEATRQALAFCRSEKAAIGFKDLGAGGIACVTSELAAHGGFGMDIDLDREVQDGGPFPAEVVACSETQERFCLVVPSRLSAAVLRIYNEDFELPRVYPGAGARVIGNVRNDGRYRVTYRGVVVVDAPVTVITEGIRYDRPSRPVPPAGQPASLPPIADFAELVLRMVAHPNVASREYIYRHYDTEVQARAIFRPGEADAALFLPIPGSPIGVAVSVDGNPRYGRLDPYRGGLTAVAEAMRNVAAIGATPACLTDCLNFGNPEDPEVFHEFRESVRGLGDAARRLGLKGEPGAPVPFVSGNVSLYNFSATGRAIPPSPIVACFGILEDYSRAVGQTARRARSLLVLVGARRAEHGGSIAADLLGVSGGQPPTVDFDHECSVLYGVIDAIDRGLVLSCHDISDGGLIITLFEMLVDSELGVRLDLPTTMFGLPWMEALLSESGGFLMEVVEDQFTLVQSLFERQDVAPMVVGVLHDDRTIDIVAGGERRAMIAMEELTAAFRRTIPELMG